MTPKAEISSSKFTAAQGWAAVGSLVLALIVVLVTVVSGYTTISNDVEQLKSKVAAYERMEKSILRIEFNLQQLAYKADVPYVREVK
jgi:hypothetical protein